MNIKKPTTKVEPIIGKLEQEQQKLKGLELPIDLRVLSSTTIIDFLEAKMKEREKLELLK
ncbi:hypothetical protein J4457_06975 [Candidatus Woesearchaeota archaeon]|nr:hypothetical protein [Candidatus Woesearchaeota archaeon]